MISNLSPFMFLWRSPKLKRTFELYGLRFHGQPQFLVEISPAIGKVDFNNKRLPVLTFNPDTTRREMLIREAFHQGRGGIPMTLIAIAAVGWMQWHEQNAHLHLPWLLAAFAVALLRGAIIFQVLRFPERWTLTQREWLFNGPLMLTALLWAALPMLTFDTATDNEKFVVVCIMSGLAGGAASVLA
ncbi:MAG: hypothetical protein L6Q40_12005, partial [Azonexus sp.]|nr:hypothetical protein [Azonexus sp.]